MRTNWFIEGSVDGNTCMVKNKVLCVIFRCGWLVWVDALLVVDGGSLYKNFSYSKVTDRALESFRCILKKF